MNEEDLTADINAAMAAMAVMYPDSSVTEEGKDSPTDANVDLIYPSLALVNDVAEAAAVANSSFINLTGTGKPIPEQPAEAESVPVEPGSEPVSESARGRGRTCGSRRGNKAAQSTTHSLRSGGK